jgi:hypothetical protein
MPEGVEAGLDAWGPGARVAELRRTGGARAVAAYALAFIDFFAGFEGAVGIADFNHADFLDALRHGFCVFVCAGRRLVGRSDVINQADDGENGDDKREKTAASSCWGVLIGPVWASSWAVVWSFALMASSKN